MSRHRVKRAGDGPSPVQDAPADPRSEHLRRALGARDAAARVRHADAGLGLRPPPACLDADVSMLLERQRYLGHLELGDLQAAEAAASRMVASGAMADVAQHDHARVLLALGRRDEALVAQREAARAAPRARRSFHLWCLATFQAGGGDLEGALTTLDEARPYADRDAALLDAQAAWFALRLGRGVADLAGVVRRLRASPNREGYGQFLLGVLLGALGDARMAPAHLRAFLRRNARLDEVKRVTLAEELDTATRTLARLSEGDGPN